MTLEELIPEVSTYDEAYKNSLISKYNEFKEYSSIPPYYRCAKLKSTYLPQYFDALYYNITEVVSERFNLAILIKNYVDVGSISNILLERYFKDCLVNDYRVEHILYIDTQMLINDFQTMMEASKQRVKDYTSNYGADIILREITKAPIVIWDKFDYLFSSKYTEEKIIRYIKDKKKRFMR